ncbi:MAG: hypothetical protein LBV17_02465 [Treponema sp.]|jgi:hypothetical protein|nr:hypothetical protein [Treponema sp.]
MIGFLIRKTFYDLWDNLFRIVLINIGFLIVTAIPVFLPKLASKFVSSTALEIGLSAVGVIICSIYLSTAAYSLKSISDYGIFGFGDFFKGFKAAWPSGLVMGVFAVVLFFVVYVVIPFYMSFESPVGLLLGMIVFWAVIFALLSFQFYFTVYSRLTTNLKKAFKKCMLISLDNSGMALFVLIHNFVALILSALLAFIFPGPAGALLYLDEALRLRLLKYDYLEANPGADRKKIPWDTILIEEREKTGTRTIKNLIFPWKD